MSRLTNCSSAAPVALRKESVDRNPCQPGAAGRHGVALRKESVDRNYHRRRKYLEDVAVALRKESVDRNPCIGQPLNCRERRSPQGERG